MTKPDLLYLALIAILLLLDNLMLWPAFLRRSQTDQGRARLFLWSGWMIELWTLVGVGVVLWLFEARAWGAIKLVPPHGWRLWGSICLVFALVITYGRTVVRIARSKRRKQVKFGNPRVEKLVPHTQSELLWWVAVSLSAGFCEEFIFRGYLIWYFQPRLGLWGAAALSLAVFAAGHAYQGAKGVPGVVVLGCVFTLVVLIFDSLLPAMALHALVDIQQGLVAWLLLRKVQGDSVAGLGEPA
jgi:CAAX protease family protein